MKQPCQPRLVFFAVLLALSVSGRGQAQSWSLLGPAPTGPYAVGVRAFTLVDSSRADPRLAATDRRIRTLSWYPAQNRTAPNRPTVNELLASGADGIQSLPPVRISWRTRGDLDAPRAVGRFPVILYAPGSGGPAYENSSMFEEIASFGYVVLSSPSAGSNGPMTPTLDGLEAQVGDLARLLRYAMSLPNVDSTRIVAMGFSWGGMANLVAAMRHGSIGATISLDGSASYYFETVLTKARDAEPRRLTVPSLFLLSDSALVPASGRSTSRYAFFEQLTGADHFAFALPPLRHRNFSESSLRAGSGTSPSLLADRAIATTGYERITRIVLAFLDAYVQGDERSRRVLRDGARALGVSPTEARVRLVR